jgi:acetyltransferase-like isoleucine patch superfamily enzyme
MQSLTPERTLEERRRLAAWWAGDRREPIWLDLGAAPCVCESLVARNREDVRMLSRVFVMALANHAPFSALRVLFARLAGARVAERVFVSPAVMLDPLYPQLLEISRGALLGIGCRLITHEYTATQFRLGTIRVGEGAVIGAFATIRSGTTIGAGATIGMNSFVNRDVPAGATVAGVPARALARRPER